MRSSLTGATARNATGPEWVEPPLPHTDAARPYPLDALPQKLGRAVEEVNHYIRAPVPIPAMCALSAAAAAVQSHCDVRVGDMRRPTSIWSLSLAVSGERKTTADSKFTEPVRKWQNEQRARLTDELASYKAECDAHEIAIEAAKRQLRSAKNSNDRTDAKKALADEISDTPSPVHVPAILIGDATIEKILYRLAHEYPSAYLSSSEAGQIFGGYGMRAESIMANLAHLNALWDGQAIDIDRRTSDSYTVQGARLSQCLAVQPATFSEFMNKSGTIAEGSGHLARFLFAAPDSTIGDRPYREPPVSWPHRDAYHARLRELLDTYPVIKNGGLSDLRELVIKGDAMRDWIAAYDAIEAACKRDGDLHCITASAAKGAENIARLAGVLAIFERGLKAEINAKDVESARLIVLWHLSETRRMTGTASAPDAQAVERWISARGGKVSRKDFMQKATPKLLRKAATLDAALERLNGLHRAQQCDGVIYLHPSIGEGDS